MVLLVLPSASGTAAALRRVPGIDAPVKAMAFAGAGALVITETGVVVLDRAGERVRTIWPAAESVGALSRGGGRRALDADAGGSWSALGVPADVDWAREYDREEIDDADDPRLADELGGDGTQDWQAHGTRSRRSDLARRGPGTEAYAVAAGGGREAWVGRIDGLWQVDLDTGAVTRPADDQMWRGEVRAVAAARAGTVTVVAVARGGDLYRSRDGGRTFVPVTAAVAVTRSLKVAPDGSILFVGSAKGELWAVPPLGTKAHDLSLQGVEDVAPCGQEVLILREGAVFAGSRWRDRSQFALRKVAEAPAAAKHIVCSEDGATWVVSGEQVCLSVHRGATWTAAPLPPGTATGLALVGGRIWIAGSSGLWELSIKPAGMDGEPRAARGSAYAPGPPKDSAALEEGFRDRMLRPTEPRWTTLLPRVDLLFAVAHTAAKQELRGLVVLTFSASGARAEASREAGRVLDVARWRQASRAAEALRPSKVESLGVADRNSAGTAAEDSISVDERSAVLRILEEETRP